MQKTRRADLDFEVAVAKRLVNFALTEQSPPRASLRRRTKWNASPSASRHVIPR